MSRLWTSGAFDLRAKQEPFYRSAKRFAGLLTCVDLVRVVSREVLSFAYAVLELGFRIVLLPELGRFKRLGKLAV